MFAYRITEVDSRIVVSTDEEPILVCASREVAHRAIADAKQLAITPAKPILSRRKADVSDE